METGRGWGMWCGSWMDVDGGGVWFENGVDREGVRSWMGVYREWRWTYWTNREWRKHQTKTNMNTY